MSTKSVAHLRPYLIDRDQGDQHRHLIALRPSYLSTSLGAKEPLLGLGTCDKAPPFDDTQQTCPNPLLIATCILAFDADGLAQHYECHAGGPRHMYDSRHHTRKWCMNLPECSESRPPFAGSIVKMSESGAEALESQGQLATSRRQI